MTSSFRPTPTITSVRQAQLDADVAKRIIERLGNTPPGTAVGKPVIPGTNIRAPRWLDPSKLYKNPTRMLNPRGKRGGLIYGAALYGANEALGRPLPAKDFAMAETLLTGGLNPASILIGGVLHDIHNPFAHGSLYDESTGKLMPNVQAERKIRIDRGEEDPYPRFDKFGNPPLGPYDHEFKVPSPDDPVLSLSSDGKGLVWVTRAQRDASLQPPVARETEEKNSEDGPPLPETRPPAVENQEPVSPTPNNMQSELLQEATTMRRAKEMKELGIHGGDEAMNKESAMHKWLSTHGELADNLIRDKRMREVRVAREFDRDLPTDARGLDGQMGNFEAFNVYS